MVSYQLFIKLSENISIRVGKLGLFAFPRGNYIYTGSARRNIEARIKRHISNHKILRWHIDYFLENERANIITYRKTNIEECLLNKECAGEIVVPSFGSSDCRSNCGSHLKLIK